MPRRRLPPPFPVRIQRLEPKGFGGATVEGREVRVRHAPPGALVEACPVTRRRGVLVARRGALLEPPPEAVDPRCPLFGTCGGCALQELPLPAQRAARNDLVLRQVGPLEGVEVGDPVGDDAAYGYRNRVELTFGTRRHVPETEWAAGVTGEGRFLGFHAPERFDRLVDVAACHLVSPALNQVLGAARAQTLASSLPPWDARAHTGFWRHLLLRETATGDRMAAVFTAPPPSPEADAEIQALADALPGVSGVAWYVNPGVADAATGALRAVPRGRDWLEERLGTLTFRLSPTSFFQTNTRGAEVLCGVVAGAAGTGRRLLDLYCGTGALGLWLAPGFDEVVGVETWAPAVADAEANARRNGVSHARFLHGEVEALAGPDLVADVVVVDPPRAGLHPRAAAWLADHPARRLVYVACNPASLGRDRGILEAGGWRMASLQAVDLFPQTAHMEAVAAFTRG